VSQEDDEKLAEQILNQAQSPAAGPLPSPAPAPAKRQRWRWWVPRWFQKLTTRDVRAGASGDADDLSLGDSPPAQIGQSVDNLLAESRSRRRHRMCSAILVFVVVAFLVAGVRKILSGLSKNLQHIDPAAVGLVASLVIAISVLTLTLVKYAFSEPKTDEKSKDKTEPVAPPALEAVKVAGDMLIKAGEMIGKVAKP